MSALRDTQRGDIPNKKEKNMNVIKMQGKKNVSHSKWRIIRIL